MEGVVLNMNYRGVVTEVKIDDIDKVLLIDVINDLLDEAEKHNHPLPTNPTLAYSYKMKSYELLDDKGLMEMFSRWKERRLFDIWIGEGLYPSHPLQLTRNLRLTRKLSENIKIIRETVETAMSSDEFRKNPTVATEDDEPEPLQVTKPAAKITPRRSRRLASTQSSGVDAHEIENAAIDTPSQPSQPFEVTKPAAKITPRRSSRLTSLQTSEIDADAPNYAPNDTHSLELEPNYAEDLGAEEAPTRSNGVNFYTGDTSKPQNKTLHSKSASTIKSRRSARLNFSSDTDTQHTQLNDMVTQPSQEPSATVSRFKMPKTTAKKRNLFIAKERGRRDVNEGTVTRTRGVRIEYDDDGGSDSDSEGDYMPTEEEDDIDVGQVSDLEDEDTLMLANLDYIDDGYVPFDENVWFDEEDGISSKMLRNGEVYDDKDFGAIKLRPWMLFMDKEHFKDVLRDFCIQEGFFVVVVKADNSRYTAECATVGCTWRIHASVLPDSTTWAIKSIANSNHGCVGVRTHNPMANSVWVARKMLEDIRANPDIPGKAIQALLQERYGIQLKTSTLYAMKDVAMKEINGGHDESYKRLPAYCEMIKQTNPDSFATCAWQEMESPERPLQFKSVFISFHAQFMGLMKGCRSLIGVDGTHLKGNHGGVLLSAVALDGNNELFPIAVSIVESESKDSWSNFFWHLKNSVSGCERDDWTIICDRQKGVEPAMETVWPEASRRFCCRHLCANFKKEYPGVLMYKLFWTVVNATSEFTFKKALETVLYHGGKGCVRWFLDLGDKEQWAKYKFNPTLCNDENTSNFVESFNATLGAQRCLPVLTLLEGVRRIAMVRHATRMHIAESWPNEGICPNIVNKLRILRKDSRTCKAFLSHKDVYEVQDGRSYLRVSLEEYTCACGLWQVSGIPCKHAIRAILECNKDPQYYVSEWFSVRTYKDAYELPINPIPDLQQWPQFEVPTLEPPTLKRSIGRPSRNRKREVGEKRKGKRTVAIRCKKCRCYGHNSKTCKGGYTTKEKNAMQGKVAKTKRQGLTLSSDVQRFESLADLEASVREVGETSSEVHGGNGKVSKTRRQRSTVTSDAQQFETLEELEATVREVGETSSQVQSNNGKKRRKN